jgi:hypothetical protein
MCTQVLKKALLFYSLAIISINAQAQFTITDNFADRSKFIDNTLLTLWDVNATPLTAFDLGAKTDGSGLQFNALTLRPSLVNTATMGYITATSLKTLSSIDYEFPSVVDRNVNDIIVEFDGIWDAQTSSGENGRLVVTLMGDYPTGGATLGQVDDISLNNPFGRPLYNIRLRNNPSAGNGPLMLYGAGVIPDPEWEKYTTGPWWLPGFSVQAGGGSPGSGPDYPGSGTKKSSLAVTSITKWRHYTWVIKPERMLLYYRNTDQSATSDQLVFFMQIPKNISSTYVVNEINAAHGTSIASPPPNYNWFGTANAVRFYWRGAQNSHLTNVKVTVQAAGILSQAVSDFKVQQQAGAHKLYWTDLSHSSATHYNVEYSNNGRNFTTLASVNAAPNTSLYNIEHTIANAPRNFYRIKRYAKNGDFSYSEIVSVNNKPAKQIFDGISNDRNSVYCNVAGSTMMMQLINMAGQTQLSLPVKSVTDISTLPRGSYIIAIKQNGVLVETHKFIK